MSDFEVINPVSGTGDEPSGPKPLSEGLNPAQKRAVFSPARALLIVAGAGSGKTRVLTHRIARLIRDGEAWPSQILAITFTNKAAQEMRERLQKLIASSVEGMWVSTFHSACVKILRREAERLGYTPGFTIYDSADSRALLKRIINRIDADSYGFTPANVAAKISRLKNELSDGSSDTSGVNADDPRHRLFVEIFTSYDQELRRANALDFDDLIVKTVHLLRAHPDVAALYRRRFRYVLVDEYQDTNHAQYSLVRELLRHIAPEQVQNLIPSPRAEELNSDGCIEAASLTVVGDSDQSIYSFRGADIRNITEFERDFADAEVVTLEQNYRSTQTILTAANSVIGHNFDRQEKNLFTTKGEGSHIVAFTGYSQHDEAQFVAEEIRQLHTKGTPYNDIAVFYRTNSQTRALEEMLVRCAIPYRVLGGTKFYERSEIKDAMAYLTSLANPYDPIAWSRLLSAPKRGIGPMTEAHLARFQQENSISFHEAMKRANEVPHIGAKQRESITRLAALLERATIMALGNTQKFTGDTPQNDDPATTEYAPVGEVLHLLLEQTEMITKLREKRDPQDDTRAENLEELLAVAREFDAASPGAGLLAFLTEVSLVAAADDLDDSNGTVSLMTLHTAKGLEFDTVFMTGVEEGVLPHQMSLDEAGGISEERRLMYVGMTRARERLFFTLAATRATYGEISVAMPSRFLQEIPQTLIHWRQSPAEVTGMTRLTQQNPPTHPPDHPSHLERSRPERVTSSAVNARVSTPGTPYGSRRSRGTAESAVTFHETTRKRSPSAVESETASGNMQSSLEAWRERKRLARQSQSSGRFPNMIGQSVRENSDLTLEVGDRIMHDDYGQGRVILVTGTGSKRIAHIDFETVGERKMLMQIAPISKIQ